MTVQRVLLSAHQGYIIAASSVQNPFYSCPKQWRFGDQPVFHSAILIAFCIITSPPKLLTEKDVGNTAHLQRFTQNFTIEVRMSATIRY